MRWEVFFVLNLTITAPTVALFGTWLSPHIVEVFGGSDGDSG